MIRKFCCYSLIFVLLSTLLAACSAGRSTVSPIEQLPTFTPQAAASAPTHGATQAVTPTVAATVSGSAANTPTTSGGAAPGTVAPPLPVAPRHHADSFAASISGNGRYIVYQSSSGDLIDQDLPACPQANLSAPGAPCQQVYLYDHQSTHTELVSAGPDGAPGNASSGAARLSDDGRYVVFSSYATNLVGSGASGGATPGLFISDRQNKTTSQITQDGANPAISADGRYIVYEKGAASSGTGLSNIALFNRVTGSEQILTRPDPQATGAGLGPPGSSYSPSISADGNWIAFWSWDGHLVTGDDKLCGQSNCGDVFLYNRIQEQLTRIPMDAAWGVGMTFYPTSLSADGRFLVTANLLYDQSNGTSTRTQLSGGIISADGYLLLGARGPQVYIQALDKTSLEQVSLGIKDQPANGPLIASSTCMGPPQCQFETSFDFSADGRMVVFDSTGDNLAGPDPYLCAPANVVPHNCADIFLRDRQTQKTEWISKPVRPAAVSAHALPTGAVAALTSLERTADIARAGSPTRSEHAYTLQPKYWRYDTRSTPPQPREPEIVSSDGKDTWRYTPGNNTETITTGAIAGSQLNREPLLFGAAEGVTSLQGFVADIKPCYPNPTYLGAGDVIAGRASYVFYLGVSACKDALVKDGGPEAIWLDQQTLVALRWVVPTAQSPLPLYVLSVGDIFANPDVPPAWFTAPSVPGAQVLDQRQ